MTSSDPPTGAERLVRGGRPLKRWRYVGVFGEELMVCAALVRVGPARQSFWALYRRGEGELRQRTRLLPRRRELQLAPGRLASADGADAPGVLRIRDRGVVLDLRLDEQPGIEARCAHGREHVWTRKQAGVGARGTLAIDGAPAREVRARAVIDDTAGYHARHTEWWWSAGVGQAPDGAALAWNLVSGVNDPPSASERTAWVDGVPRELSLSAFSGDLLRVDGLRFQPEAIRERRDNLLVIRSSYRQPFGTFAGELAGVALAEGYGVMEEHDAWW